MSGSAMIRVCRCVHVLLVAVCLGIPAAAEQGHLSPAERQDQARNNAGVLRSSPSGFSVRHETTLNVSPQEAYRALVQDIAQWWESDHTISGDSGNLAIDARAGGCFCESLPEGGGVTHLTVVHADPGKLLRLTGGLGPLQGEAVSGSMSWNLEETATGTRMTLTYNVWGQVDGGLEAWAEPVGRVLEAQLNRLAAHVDSGAAGAKPPNDPSEPE